MYLFYNYMCFSSVRPKFLMLWFTIFWLDSEFNWYIRDLKIVFDKSGKTKKKLLKNGNSYVKYFWQNRFKLFDITQKLITVDILNVHQIFIIVFFIHSIILKILWFFLRYLDIIVMRHFWFLQFIFNYCR